MTNENTRPVIRFIETCRSRIGFSQKKRNCRLPRDGVIIFKLTLVKYAVLVQRWFRGFQPQFTGTIRHNEWPVFAVMALMVTFWLVLCPPPLGVTAPASDEPAFIVE
jgi:hypothetical protein